MLSPINPAVVPPPREPAFTQATQDIEALFVRQMLAAARKVSLADDADVLGSSATRTFAEMRDASFADIAAQSEAFGLAQMFADTLSKDEPKQ